MSHRSHEAVNFAWTQEQIDAYHKQYQEVAEGDSLLASVVIKAIGRRGLINVFDSAHIIGAGAVPRGAGIVLPTLTETASLHMSDVTEENVNFTENVMKQIKHSHPDQAHWSLHEQDMANHDRRWSGAIGRAATIATFGVFDLLREYEDNEEGARQSQVNVMEYVGESIREAKDDYERAMKHFTDSAEEMVYMAYSVKSDGWKAGSNSHPAYPVSVDQAAERIERGGFELLHDPHEGFAPKASDFRQNDDPHDFDGFAALVAVRR